VKLKERPPARKHYNAATTRERWEDYSRSPPTRIGVGTIFWLANEADPDWLRRYDNDLKAKMDAANSRANIDFWRAKFGLPPREANNQQQEEAAQQGHASTQEENKQQEEAKQEATSILQWHGEKSVTTTGPWLVKNLLREPGSHSFPGNGPQARPSLPWSWPVPSCSTVKVNLSTTASSGMVACCS
jgi:hypothetical protein